MKDIDVVIGMVQNANYLITLFNVAISLLFINIVQSTATIHCNLKIMLITISVQFRLFALSRLSAEFVYNLTPQAALTAPFCTCMSFVNAFMLGFEQLCFVSVIVERAIATAFRDGYDAWGNQLAKAVFGVLCTLSALYALWVMWVDRTNWRWFPADEHMTTCVVVYKRPMIVILSWFVFGLLLACGLVPILYLYYYNERRARFHRSVGLTARYQYHDNVVVLRIFAPLIALGAFGVGSACIGVMCTVLRRLVRGAPLNPRAFLAFKLTFVAAECCCTAYELAFLRFHPALYGKLRRWARCVPGVAPPKRTVYRVDPLQADIYFGQLSRAW